MTIVPIDVRLLHEGENIIAYRIIGDPSLKLTGFYRQKDYMFGSYADLESRYSMRGMGALIFLYFIIGLFAVVIFLFGRRAEKYILYYGLLTLVVAIYIFTRTPFSYAFFKDSRIVMTAEFLSLFLITPMVGLMFDYFIASEVSLFTKIYSAFCILCSVAVLASPVAVNFDILLLWQVSSILPIIYYPRMIIVKGVIPDYRKFDAAVVHEKTSVRRLIIFRNTLFESYSGIIITGIVICTSTFVIDIIDSMTFSKGLTLTRYGLFGFTMSMGFLIAAKYNSLHHSLEKLNVELKEKIVTINEANSRLTLSEEKYRFLVDYSTDFIFILNIDGSFLSANNALLKSMRISSSDLNKHSIFDLLFQDENNIDNTLIHNNFIEMVQNKGKTRFKAKFRSPGVLNDPKAFTVFLDYTSMDGRDLILGKAVHAGDDTLQDFFLSERQKYRINNYLFSAEQMSQRIAGHAEKYLSRDNLESFRISLREVLINAIEHGNLGITYQEKTNAMENDRYFEFIKERQCDPRNRSRRVEVEYSIDETKIVCKVTNEGQGFDHRTMMADRASKANDEMLEHGRGLHMADNFFDKITFNAKGNQILLTKFLSPQRESD
jgi:PAS domain S-box-containing protein